jgi:hypothetical protein
LPRIGRNVKGRDLALDVADLLARHRCFGHCDNHLKTVNRCHNGCGLAGRRT